MWLPAKHASQVLNPCLAAKLVWRRFEMLLATNVDACQLVRLHIMFAGLLTLKGRCYNSPTVGSGFDFLAIEEAWALRRGGGVIREEEWAPNPNHVTTTIPDKTFFGLLFGRFQFRPRFGCSYVVMESYYCNKQCGVSLSDFTAFLCILSMF